MSAHFDVTDAWYLSPHGEAVRRHGFELLHYMLHPWPRRAQTLLVVGSGSGHLLPHVWEAGFDVTCVDVSARALLRVQERMGGRVALEVAPLDHLPFGDNSFDFVLLAPPRKGKAVVEDILEEAVRVSVKGLLLIYWNSHSLAGMGRHAVHSPFASVQQEFLWLTSRQCVRCLRNLAPQGRIRARSILPTPTSLWTRSWSRFANSLISPLPWGALGMVGVDHASGTPLTGTPLRLKTLGMMGRAPQTAMECGAGPQQRTE